MCSFGLSLSLCLSLSFYLSLHLHLSLSLSLHLSLSLSLSLYPALTLTLSIPPSLLHTPLHLAIQPINGYSDFCSHYFFLSSSILLPAEENLGGSCPPLEGAVEGMVCTRFPPEPSGYLHIGQLRLSSCPNANLYICLPTSLYCCLCFCLSVCQSVCFDC